MQKLIIKTTLGIIFVASLSGQAFAASNELPTVFAGTLACTGTQMNGQNITHYRLINFNEKLPITITKLRLFDASGKLKFSASSGKPFPAGFKSTLQPNNITTFHSEDVFGDTRGGPLQLLIDFTFKKPAKGLALHALTSKITKDATGSEIGRSDEGCSYIKLTR